MGNYTVEVLASGRKDYKFDFRVHKGNFKEVQDNLSCESYGWIEVIAKNNKNAIATALLKGINK